MMTSNSYNLKMGGDDPEYLDADNDWEINYWSYKLKCSKEELKIAAKEVGSKMDNIRQFITLINVAKKREARDNDNLQEESK